MRLVLVSPYDPAPPTPQEAAEATVGGVERVLERMAIETAKAGHEVTLLCTTSGPSRADWEGDVRIVRVHRSAALLRAPIAGLARHLPPEADLVHVPATYPFNTGPVLREAARRRVPSVLDFHFEPDPGHALGQAAARAYRAWGPRAYAHARLVLVRSRSYARASPSLRSIPEDRWRIVPNGVDPRRFHPRGAARPGGYLLVVGRLVPYKGVGVLLDALATLRDAPPLLIVGDGPLRSALERQAGRLGVDATFLGRVPDEALPSLYRGARITVLPSANGQEAFGIALAESLACGTPVVASRLPGVEEVASLGGLLARPGDAASLARALRQALEPGALPRGEALARSAHALYAWPSVAKRLLAAYDEALGLAPPEVMPPAPARSHPLL